MTDSVADDLISMTTRSRSQAPAMSHTLIPAPVALTLLFLVTFVFSYLACTLDTCASPGWDMKFTPV